MCDRCILWEFKPTNSKRPNKNACANESCHFSHFWLILYYWRIGDTSQIKPTLANSSPIGIKLATTLDEDLCSLQQDTISLANLSWLSFDHDLGRKHKKIDSCVANLFTPPPPLRLSTEPLWVPYIHHSVNFQALVWPYLPDSIHYGSKSKPNNNYVHSLPIMKLFCGSFSQNILRVIFKMLLMFVLITRLD